MLWFWALRECGAIARAAVKSQSSFEPEFNVFFIREKLSNFHFIDYKSVKLETRLLIRALNMALFKDNKQIPFTFTLLPKWIEMLMCDVIDTKEQGALVSRTRESKDPKQ